MGWVPPPAPPLSDPAGCARHRAYLVSVLGYDPAIESPPRFAVVRFIFRYLFGRRL